MKKFALTTALKLIPQKKQQHYFVNAINQLITKPLPATFVNQTLEFALQETKHRWLAHYDGQKFQAKSLKQTKPLNKEHISPLFRLSFPWELLFSIKTKSQLIDAIEQHKVTASGNEKAQQLVLELCHQIDEYKIHHYRQRLSRYFGVKVESIQEIPLADINHSHIGGSKDVDYIRDQAIKQEDVNPALALQLMEIARVARPQGPFIKKKLQRYKRLGYDQYDIATGKLIKKGIALPNLNLIYVPVPKVACTSIKHTCYELLHGHPFDHQAQPANHIHQYWDGKMTPLTGQHTQVIVIRDPIKRLLSAYGNRVKFHGELTRHYIEKNCPHLLGQLPMFNPTLKQFIEHLEEFMQVPSIEHHCCPLSTLVQNDLSEFEHIYPLEQLHEFERLLSTKTQTEVQFPREQTHGKKIKIHELSQQHLNLLFDFYQQDYDLLKPWYSKETLLGEWRNGRRDHH